MKYYIIAGEASGDLHASNLIREIKQLDPNAVFRAWGGDLVKAQGATLVKHYRDLAFMGFTEVLLNLKTILNNIDFCKKDISSFDPDVLILVDYPGFNLRIAEYAKKAGLKVFYYISPQIWAWKQSRVHKIKRLVDHMFVILPFEKEFYKRFDQHVDFVGHPLLDAIDSLKPEVLSFSNKPVIALLPGSRKQEIAQMLPVMLSVKPFFKDYHFVIAGAPAVPKEFYATFIDQKQTDIIYNQTYALLKQSHAAIVTSGTATLETALFCVPEVVCYKGSKISYYIARKLIKVKYISLVNLIMDKEVVTELIQDSCNTDQIRSELEKIVMHTPRREKMIQAFHELRSKLGGAGASKKTASLILKYLSGK